MELNDVQKNYINNKLNSLSKSKFRSSFKLRKKELAYLEDKGIEVIEEHAFTFVKDRLSKAIIKNDGKQTPMKGHPVFIAQHATATCCRGCLYKWHHIEQARELSEKEIKFIVALIMKWIKNDMERRGVYEEN